MRKLLRSTKGFTLVELSVTLVILTVVVGLSSVLILSGGNVLAENASLTEAKQVADAVISLYRQKITYADEITLGNVDDAERIVNESNIIKYSPGASAPEDLYSTDFYGNRKVNVSLSSSGASVTVTVTVAYGAGGEYSETQTIKALNLSLKNGSVSGSDTTAISFAAGSGGGDAPAFPVVASYWPKQSEYRTGDLGDGKEVLSGGAFYYTPENGSSSPAGYYVVFQTINWLSKTDALYGPNFKIQTSVCKINTNKILYGSDITSHKIIVSMGDLLSYNGKYYVSIQTADSLNRNLPPTDGNWYELKLK